MSYNWQEIKKEIIKETEDVFQSSGHRLENFDLEETVELFEDILFFSLDDPALDLNGLSNLLSGCLYKILVEESKERNLYFPSIVKVEQYLRKLLYLMDSNKYKKLNIQRKGLAAFITELGLNKESINLNSPELPASQKGSFGEHLFNVNKLRNVESHKCKQYSRQQIFTGLKSALVIYIYATFLHQEKLKSILKNLKTPNYQSYFETVKSDFDRWKNRFVHLNGREEFEEISLYIVETDWNNSDEDEITTIRREGKIDELRQQLIKSDQFQMVIVGDAGMGKSTTMQYLAYNDSCQKNVRLPIYIELKLLTKDTTIKQYMIKRSGFKLEELDDILKQGNTTIFLDGLNELLPEIKPSIFTEIKSFIRDFPKTFIMLSSRPRDYKNDFSSVPVFALQKMENKQIKEFLEKNTTSQSIREQILNLINDDTQKSQRWQKIISTPLMLFMLIRITKQEDKIPNDESKIILKFIDNLYRRERQKDIHFNIDYFHLMLSYLAYESIEIKGNTNSGLNLGDIEKILQKKEKDIGTGKIIEFLNKAKGLNILSIDDNLYSFTHQSYQETLAGDYLNILFYDT